MKAPLGTGTLVKIDKRWYILTVFHNLFDI
jgi:hypothetical protein